MTHIGVDIVHPFVYTTKDWIVNQYSDNKILDLFDITRSCEGEFEGLNYKTYTLGDSVPVCGECFWCKEREWAIEQAIK
jgi:7-cyano-7-deazaguanine synthase in queuosine biosynthesis